MPNRIVGRTWTRDEIVATLTEIGCRVESAG